MILKNLFDSGKVQKIVDLYKLKCTDLTKFEGVKEASAKKALNNLFAVEEISLEKFIAGFNIENMGEMLVKKVVDAGYNTLDMIRNSSINELAKVDGFAEITAKILLDGLKQLYPEMVELLNLNKIKIKDVMKKMSGKFDGKTFCFTGKLEDLKRAEAENMVIEQGGEPKKSVVKNLSYLVTNSSEPTTKYRKAQDQGTKIIT